MIQIKEAILVEGRYDVNKIKQIFDTIVIETAGFGIFSDKSKKKMLLNLAEKRGLIVLTDSDGGGLVIRNHIKKFIPKEYVKHAYVPEIAGKEKRKRTPGKEFLLGVEGMQDEVIIQAIKNAGATYLMETMEPHTDSNAKITKATLYETGLTGQLDSHVRRQKLQRYLELPSNLSANALIDYCNCLYTKSEFIEIVNKITSNN